MIWSLLLDTSAYGARKIAEDDHRKLIEAVVGLSITAMIMFVPGRMVVRYVYSNIRKEFRFKTTFNQYNHIDALVLLSMNVLRTNPDCFKEKCIYLKEYIAYLYPKSDSFHESLRIAYSDVYRSESIVNWLKRFQTEEEQRDVVHFLTHMAAQDGVIAPREKAELFKIIDAFAMARKEWEDLMDSINDAFAKQQSRRRNTRNTRSENDRDDLIVEALDYFGMKREAIDEEQLRDKYRKLVKEYHPDRHPDASPEQRNELEVKFQELQMHYEELLKLLS